MNIGRSLVILWVLLYYGLVLRAPRARRLRMALERLGPIFVKFGQVLSTRRDLLAPDIASELSLLQDRVPPFPGTQAIAAIEKALGQSIDAIFSSFDANPVASASIAQVHFATLHSGEAVAVKVLRPRVHKAIEKDLRWMRLGAAWLERLSLEARRLKPRAVVAEFDGYLHDELDLVREAANACALRRNMENLHLVRIPGIYWDYCRNDVLVMQRMTGMPIREQDALREAGVDLPKLARDGVVIFYTQVFNDGFFHADMHPGNIQVSLEPETFGQYIALDFGIVGTLSAFDKEYLAQNFAAFFNRDYKRVAQLHIESGWVAPNTRAEELESAIRTVCEPFFNRPLREVSLGLILMRLFQVSRRFEVEIQPQLVLLQKTLLNIEGLGRQLDPELDLWGVSKPFLEKWMREELGPKRLWRELKKHTPQYIQLLPQLPLLLNNALQQKQLATQQTARIQRLQKKNTRLIWLLGLTLLALVLTLLFYTPIPKGIVYILHGSMV